MLLNSIEMDRLSRTALLGPISTHQPNASLELPGESWQPQAAHPGPLWKVAGAPRALRPQLVPFPLPRGLASPEPGSGLDSTRATARLNVRHIKLLNSRDFLLSRGLNIST